ncbi:DUF4139 domain-containing protein [Pelagibacterium lentulum]|uniref:DUF4139 domain-containing protein n=1 Tax=Pelagibacterium lentulum TaxID=2029865 RepID=A0A916RK95_9HYPH|nr:DUF4139 domain-containing protein [Pelagibacterium lentulum]GGA57038.1 hypothetical protein GCM10011499_29070 [Pelagibacterium lentulum]
MKSIAVSFRSGRTRRENLSPLKQALLCASLVLLLPAASVFAQQTPQMRIDALTLSSGGLAEIRRSISLVDAQDLTFDVPLDQVNDILKSLVVYDPAGGIAFLILDGLAPVDETFRGLPFTPADIAALPQLLDALRGVSVQVSSGGRTVEGIVLGVQTDPFARDDSGPAAPLLSVMTYGERIEVLELGPDSALEIWDEAMRERLRTAATVSGQGRVDSMRSITLGLAGSGARDVHLDYVVPAPVWKTAYRLILESDDLARLQAWAIIENASGDDWDGVTVTLSSGAPVTLTQNLHQRYWHQRPEIPVLAQTIMPVQPDRFGGASVDDAEQSAVMEHSMDIARTAAPGVATLMGAPRASMPQAQAAASEGETTATYRLPAPIDLPSGQTLSLPFVDTELPTERIALFQPERGGVHPVAALRIENATGTSLPPGIVTVYAPLEEGYAGDAQVHALPAGESRMISFAADRKVEVTTERGNEQTFYRASLADGVLRTTSITRVETVYTIRAARDAARTVIIEQPRREGWTFSSDVLDENTPTHHRLRSEVPAGGTATATATFERTATDTISLVDLDASDLLFWSGQIDDPQIAGAVSTLAERRQEIARAQRDVSALERAIENAASNQARVRDNLAAVPANSSLAQRYLAMLEEQEDAIADFERQNAAAKNQLRELREQFAELVKGL